MWVYRAGGHILQIIPMKDGLFGFQFDDDPTIWEASKTPEIEASNIALHVTGCSDWDELEKVDCPESLSEWTNIPS